MRTSTFVSLLLASISLGTSTLATPGYSALLLGSGIYLLSFEVIRAIYATSGRR